MFENKMLREITDPTSTRRQYRITRNKKSHDLFLSLNFSQDRGIYNAKVSWDSKFEK
jgi:hypothetical protein